MTGETQRKFYIVDITNPAAMTVAGQIEDTTCNGMFGFAKAGERIFIACKGSSRMIVLDISNPTAPVKVGDKQDATFLNNVHHVAMLGGGYLAAAAKSGDLVSRHWTLAMVPGETHCGNFPKQFVL